MPCNYLILISNNNKNKMAQFLSIIPETTSLTIALGINSILQNQVLGVALASRFGTSPTGNGGLNKNALGSNYDKYPTPAGGSLQLEVYTNIQQGVLKNAYFNIRDSNNNCLNTPYYNLLDSNNNPITYILWNDTQDVSPNGDGDLLQWNVATPKPAIGSSSTVPAFLSFQVKATVINAVGTDGDGGLLVTKGTVTIGSRYGNGPLGPYSAVITANANISGVPVGYANVNVTRILNISAGEQLNLAISPPFPDGAPPTGLGPFPEGGSGGIYYSANSVVNGNPFAQEYLSSTLGS
jgi:hypothetical protein